MTSRFASEGELAPFCAAPLALGRRPFPVTAWSKRHGALLLIGLAALFGFALRLAAARGDLWLDELWSLALVSELTSPGQVFWAISHDNNHFLNSLWMYWVGQHQASIVYRLPSVVFGTLTILAGARLGWRTSQATAVAAALITACSYALVDYGSEARGYAGLILAIVLAIDLSQGAVDRLTASGTNAEVGTVGGLTGDRWRIALVIALGACAHLTMFAEAAILGLAAVVRLKAGGRSYRETFGAVFGLFWPSLLLLLPIIACVAIGITVRGQFVIGGSMPFTPGGFFDGYGGLLRELLGVPDLVPPWVAVVLVAVGLILACRAKLVRERWRGLAVVALVVWPTLVFLCEIKNTNYPRYHLVAGLVVMILLAEVVGQLWARGRFARWCGGALVAGVCLGQVSDISTLLVDHRGSYASAVAVMGYDGPARYEVKKPFSTEFVSDFYAAKAGLSVTLVDQSKFCQTPAEWFVYDSDVGQAVPDALESGPSACQMHYEKRRTFPSARWSGRVWTLFHRVP